MDQAGRVKRGQLMEVEEFRRPQILARSNVFCVDASHTKPHETGSANNNIRPTGFPAPSKKRPVSASSKAATPLWFPSSSPSSSLEPPHPPSSADAAAAAVALRQSVLGAKKPEVHKLPDRHVRAQQRREEADHLLGQLEKARRFRPRDELDDGGDHGGDDADELGSSKRAVARKKVHALKLHVLTRGTISVKRRPHYYGMHLPDYDEPRSLALELKSNIAACSMDIYVVYGSERTPGPCCFDWRAVSGTPLLIHPIAPQGTINGAQLRPGDYTLAVYADTAPLGYSVLCTTIPYKDSSGHRNMGIARSALHGALQRRVVASESRRIHSRNSKEVQQRPLSAPPSRAGADTDVEITEVLGGKETQLLKQAIGDEKTVDGLCDMLHQPEPFNMSSRMVSVNELAFNPDKIRSDVAWLLSNLGSAGTAQSRDALSHIDVTALADRLTSSVLDKKLVAPTTKVLAPPSRPASSLGERFENRENLAFLKSIDPGAGQKTVAEKKGGGIAGVKPVHRVKWPNKVGRARGSMVELKMMIVKNLYGGLPEATLGVLSANAQDYRTHSWEDMKCRLDETSAMWADPVEVEKIDMGAKHKDKEAKQEGPRILCVLQELLSVEETELPDQPSYIFCFRLNFDSGSIDFAAHSQEDRKTWVRAAQLFGEAAEIAAFGGVENIENSALVKRAKESARAKLAAAARQAEAAGRKLDAEVGRVMQTEGGDGEASRAASGGRTGTSSLRARKPRPSSAFAGAVSIASELALEQDRHPATRPASAMHRPASALSIRADTQGSMHADTQGRAMARPASALARTSAPVKSP